MCDVVAQLGRTITVILAHSRNHAQLIAKATTTTATTTTTRQTWLTRRNVTCPVADNYMGLALPPPVSYASDRTAPREHWSWPRRLDGASEGASTAHGSAGSGQRRQLRRLMPCMSRAHGPEPARVRQRRCMCSAAEMLPAVWQRHSSCLPPASTPCRISQKLGLAGVLRLRTCVLGAAYEA